MRGKRVLRFGGLPRNRQKKPKRKARHWGEGVCTVPGGEGTNGWIVRTKKKKARDVKRVVGSRSDPVRTTGSRQRLAGPGKVVERVIRRQDAEKKLRAKHSPK